MTEETNEETTVTTEPVESADATPDSDTPTTDAPEQEEESESKE